ncbi:DUF2254 domain-containing protein [Gelidibacter salicanalis]|uniref:DUF2254 domain-containing protein n=1 Tax=Gelidibacter salicanalis TaxID=291193 RepID=A0A934KXK2_9FLAO|nr:DUF2254 domain-containing protein [Gelidibacter salicanalis]MBJ7882173.1 DUF2254 domain-containing protein [Gelidibacter salicanalis]
MKNQFYRIIEYIIKLESNIAFYPSLISLLGLSFAFFMYYLESWGVSKYLIENAPLLVINNTETARSLLSTFIGGLISIMVFSFSLVMILLNQASSNFSPRLLPGLISNRRHQIILGIYNSTLLYCIFTLVSITPTGDKYQLPGFSVLLAIVFMTLCLGAFIYFIHSISQQIQVGTIMDKIYDSAYDRLSRLIENEKSIETQFPDTSSWNEVISNKSGYFQDISLNALASFAKEKEIKIEISQIKGTYILKSLPLFRYSGAELDGDTLDHALRAFNFSKNEIVEENYVLAFKQITEIALKAMSPGINDPGTAINAIDYMTELFVLRMKKRDSSYLFDDDHAFISIKTVSFEMLMYNVMAALRTYCKHDIIVVQKLFMMLEYLLGHAEAFDQLYRKTIVNEIGTLYQDAIANQKNETDLSVIKKQMEKLKTLNESDFTI